MAAFSLLSSQTSHRHRQFLQTFRQRSLKRPRILLFRGQWEDFYYSRETINVERKKKKRKTQSGQRVSASNLNVTNVSQSESGEISCLASDWLFGVSLSISTSRFTQQGLLDIRVLPKLRNSPTCPKREIFVLTVDDERNFSRCKFLL